jgi:hypothetical protein
MKNLIRRLISFSSLLIKNTKIQLKKNRVSYYKNVQLPKTYGSQKGQIEYLLMNVFDYENSGLKRNGFFVDLAAGDGVHLSNTYFLEKHLGWIGLLFEPNPKFSEALKKERTSPIVNKPVGATAKELVQFRIDNMYLGGIVADGFDNSPKNRSDKRSSSEVIELETTTLEEELIKHCAPDIVDYLSLDIEGAEEAALSTFDFDKFKFRFISIERPTLNLDLMLDEAGYVQIKHSDFDVFYTHRDFVSEINTNPSFLFIETPRKDWF